MVINYLPSKYLDVPLGWKLGSKVIGSVGYFTLIYSIYSIYKDRWNNPLILTI